MAPTQQQASMAKAKSLSGAKKTSNAKVQRYLKSIEPQLKEGGKKALLLKGIKCSQAMATVLNDLRAMLAPNAKLLTKKNAIVAFDSGSGASGVGGQQSLEFLSTKNDCAMFALASTNKKRPNNLVLGRTFDHQILDMIEFGILQYKSMKDYGGSVPKQRIGSKPMMLFVGDEWEHNPTCTKIQNLLIDFYRGDVVDKLILSGLDHLLVFVASTSNATDGETNPNVTTPSNIVIHQRTYFCKLKKNPNDPSSKVPVPLLTSCGPDMTMKLRRTQFASSDMWKAAMKQPKSSHTKPKKVKNQSTNVFGETIGRLHLQKQDVDNRQGRKVKALRRAEKAQAEEERKAIESDLAQETKEMNQELKQTYGIGEGVED